MEQMRLNDPIEPESYRPARMTTLRDVTAIFFRRRWLLVMSFLVIFCAALFVHSLLPTKYESQMKILVKRDRVEPVVVAGSSTTSSYVPSVTVEDLNSEVELLLSRDLLEKVMDACNLNTSGQRRSDGLMSLLPEVDGPASAGVEVERARALRKLESNLSVRPISRSNLISATYSNSDPKVAAEVLQTLGSLYLEKHLEVHRSPAALTFLNAQTKQYQNDLATAEQRLAEFGQSDGGVFPEMEKERAVAKLSDFEAKLKETAAEIQEVQKRIGYLNAEMAVTPARRTTQIRTSDDHSLMQNLKGRLLELELKRTELLTKFEPGFRAVQEVDEQISQVQAALKETEQKPMTEETTDRDSTHDWLREELAKANIELAALQARSIETRAIVEDYRKHARVLNRSEIERQDLARMVATAEEHYLLYGRKLEEAKISSALDRNGIINVAIVEQPNVPALAAGKSTSWKILLSAFLAGMLSIALTLIVDWLDPSFRTPSEVEADLDVPVLAWIPSSENPDARKSGITIKISRRRDRAKNHADGWCTVRLVRKRKRRLSVVRTA